jgi:hypothetical protein
MTSTLIDILRRRLIKHFEAEQSISAEYLCFRDVAQKLAYSRASGTISEEKEKALSDLMEAAFDGVFAELLWMNPQASVELCLDRNTVEQIADELRRRGGEFDLWAEDENTALMTPDKFACMRSGLGLGDLYDRYLREKFKDSLWAPRADVVAFLKGRGVVPSDLPAAWGAGLDTECAPLKDSALYKSGGAGQPNAQHLYMAEMERRNTADELSGTLAEEARYLFKWTKEHHPQYAPGAEGSIGNAIRKRYRELKAAKNVKA